MFCSVAISQGPVADTVGEVASWSSTTVAKAGRLDGDKLYCLCSRHLVSITETTSRQLFQEAKGLTMAIACLIAWRIVVDEDSFRRRDQDSKV
jgi:hypothetical protein